MVAASVLADASIVPMFQEPNAMDADAFNPVLPITAVSCANGKLFTSTVPPEDRAQAVEFQLPPAAKFQYTVFAAVNVIFELFEQSPILVPDHVAVPAPAISLKSTSVKLEMAAAVIVTLLRTVALYANILHAALTGAPKFKVPVTVMLLPILKTLIPDDDDLVMFMLENVLAPVITMPLELVAEKFTVPKVKPPPAKVNADVELQTIVDDPIEVVKLVAARVTGEVPVNVSVLVPSVMFLTYVVVLEVKAVEVTE